MEIKYQVYKPFLQGNESKYVADCIESSWISSKGKYVARFEKEFASYVGVSEATSVCNGTVALHLALLALEIQPGDEVIVPTFTYIASVNAIAYVGAIPVFVDSLPSTWQIDCAEVSRKISAKTKAILAPHIYGHPCDMEALQALCQKHSLFLVEDCAEAIGSLYNGRMCGTFGDVSAFSFFGNKTLTTGEGGMVTSSSGILMDKIRKLKNQGLSSKEYWHDEIGYNYRMTNICAAIGLAQLEQVETIIANKLNIAEIYRKAFKGTNIVMHGQSANVLNTYWMCSILIPAAGQREELRKELMERGIETRPLFYPAHHMPMYATAAAGTYPVADEISSRGLNLPSYPSLSEEDVNFIAGQVISIVERHG